MCFTVDRNYKPSNRKYRYCVAKRMKNGQLRSPYRNFPLPKIGWRRANSDISVGVFKAPVASPWGHEQYCGFHMINTIKEAKEILEEIQEFQGYYEKDKNGKSIIINPRNYVIVKCEVEGFLCGGTISKGYCSEGHTSEAWLRRKVIEVK